MRDTSQFLSLLVLAVAVAVLSGYALHSFPIGAGAFEVPSMSLLSATGLGAIAVALLRVGFVAGVTALAAHIDFSGSGIDLLMAPYRFLQDRHLGGKASIATATCIIFLAVAQYLRTTRHIWFANIAASCPLVFAGTTLLSYAYSDRPNATVSIFSTLSMDVAVSLFALGIASVFCEADAGWVSTLFSRRLGGGPTRRQLALTLICPIAGGVVLRALEAESLGTSVAMALIVVMTVVPLIATILHDGKTLDVLDAERGRADVLSKQTAAELTRLLAEQADMLHRESDDRAKAESALFYAQRMEAVGQLTGGIAHDFNNLLMAIKSNLHLLQGLIGADQPARIHIDRAAAVTERGAALTSQLLAFSRTQRLDFRATELEPILKTGLDLIGHALGPLIRLETDFRTKNVWVHTDGVQLQLALLNLALNARDAMPGGGIIRFESAEMFGPPLKKDAKRYAVVRIVDNGVGMSPEVITRAVEPFFTTKQIGKGTGLGLAQVYGVVKQCGGELFIRSELAVGTVIEILLVTADAGTVEHPRAKPMTQSPHSESHHQQILLIDDDDDVRFAMAEMFRSVGYVVAEAENGRVGLELLAKVHPVVAVIDFLMPDMNGAQVAREARINRPLMPIIFVSGYADTVALDEISNAVVLRKPVAAEILLDQVADALLSVADID
jgi:signal transduction histidine kinase/CheY-like chemotaxis protein